MCTHGRWGGWEGNFRRLRWKSLRDIVNDGFVIRQAETLNANAISVKSDK